MTGLLALFSSSHAASHHTAVHASHSPSLVALSLLVAFISSCMAFAMLNINRQAATISHRRVSLLCASMVLGMGIWSMHFIGMLAMEFPTAVSYDAGLTALSIAPGMLAAFLALWSLQHMQTRPTRTWASGTVVGIGIAAMHYSGIAAMQVQAKIRFEWPWFVLSIALGLVFAIGAFRAQHWLLRHGKQPLNAAWRWLPSLLMAAAIASMHYVSMHAMYLELDPNMPPPTPFLAGWKSNAQLSLLIAGMSAPAFLIFGLANALLRYRDLWQAVAARDARLNAMVDTAPIGVVTIDEKGLIQEFNAQAQQIFGYQAEDVVGRNVALLMPSPLAEQHDHHLQKHLGHPEKPIAMNGREVIGKHKDGRLIPLQMSIGKANTASGTIFVGYLQDVSAQKRTDAQLRIAASVFEHVREGVAIVDANHNISDVNPAFLRLMERSRDTCIGRSLESLYDDADIPPDMSHLWSNLATEQYWQSESMLKRSDGAIWMQRISLSPVLNELQRPHHFIAVISDVTERTHLDAVLAKTEDVRDSTTGLFKHKFWMELLCNHLLMARKKSAHMGVVLLQLHTASQPQDVKHDHAMQAALHIVMQRLEKRLRSTDCLGLYAERYLAIQLHDIKEPTSFASLIAQLTQILLQTLPNLSAHGVVSISMGQATTLSGSYIGNDLMQMAQENLAPLPNVASQAMH